MSLKHHGLWCAARGLTPIFLRATELAASLRANEVSAPVVDMLLARVHAGEAALLVDSVDEVDRPDEKANVRRRLAAMAADARFARCPIFAASRSVGYMDIPGFQVLNVRPLSDDAMAELLARWEIPAVASPGAGRVYRGGSWVSPASRVRVAYRDGDLPGFRDQDQGPARRASAWSASSSPQPATLGRRP